MSQRPPLAREEVQRILAALSPLAAEHRIVLIGGQAVAWWTYFLGLENESSAIEIFTSEDIDFEGAARSAKKAAELIGGEVRLPSPGHHTPSTGQVLFHDSNGIRREIDFLACPLGLDATDVRSSAVPMRVKAAGDQAVGVLVMHPERCMESRVHKRRRAWPPKHDRDHPASPLDRLRPRVVQLPARRRVAARAPARTRGAGPQ